jgi:ubiquinone/menaquinone biosynthesis C-methylase UbiE
MTNPDLTQETEKLVRSWDQHDATWLRDYLVAGVEDPRVNLQSILSRHFLIRSIAGCQFESLMEQEYRFAAVMDWVCRVARLSADEEGRQVLLYALAKGADNAEGLEIPSFISRAYTSLPMLLEGQQVPNYLEKFLSSASTAAGGALSEPDILNTFQRIWRENLHPQKESWRPAKVLEVACGSANDYRFWDRYGLAPLLNYTGIDLCQKNIENARALFPTVQFKTGNVFEIAAEAKAYDYCVLQDLLEHLSLEGMEKAVDELCRVTSEGMCVGFFQMDERPEHMVRPAEDYHWNLLSMSRMKQLFADRGFVSQVIHVNTFLLQQFGWGEMHNKNAYTFFLKAVSPPSGDPRRSLNEPVC